MMKDIKEMTISEMVAEMRTYICRRNEGYAFISYSHRDSGKVYPLVLGWMRAGYNIYIDLDFEQHGSDSNWVDLMTSTLTDRMCRLAVCFGSIHYTYSYAALLELLTIRGKEVNNLHDEKLPVDYFVIGEIPMGNNDIGDELKYSYEEYFQRLKNVMGSDFLGQNKKEYDTLYEGLKYWLATEEVFKDTTAEEWMKYLNDAYKRGYANFFPLIAKLVKQWIVNQGVNGNSYSLDSDLDTRFKRFNNLEVRRLDRAAVVFTEPEPVDIYPEESRWNQSAESIHKPEPEKRQEEAAAPVPEPEPEQQSRRWFGRSARKNTSHTMKKFRNRPELYYVRDCSLRLKALMGRTKDRTVAKKLERAYDDLHASPVKSTDSAIEYEAEVIRLIEELEKNITVWKPEETERTLDRLISLAAERNYIIKSNQ